MTAEIAILNRRGIAMAADSAVTLGVGKIYNSADKLHALSKYHPVGIMIYSSANIMGVPWETIIKCYREEIKDTSFAKLTMYMDDFLNFLNNFPYFTDEYQEEYLEDVSYEVFNRTLNYLIENLNDEFQNKKNIPLSEIDDFINQIFKRIKEQLEAKEDEKRTNPDFKFIDFNKDKVVKILKIIFEDYELTEDQTNALIEILKLCIQKCHRIDRFTGVVIAGYGDNEIFPALCQIKVGGKIGESLICFDYKEGSITTNNSAWIEPFAQTEIVSQFMEGIDPEFYKVTLDKVKTMLESLTCDIKNFNSEKENALSEILKDYLDSISRVAFINPILDVVAGMEKGEIVSMAEALVNITALKRHVSDDEESVGGPIDVALITKNDGFIYIKNKTNYNPDINRGLEQNYFRSKKNENI